MYRDSSDYNQCVHQVHERTAQIDIIMGLLKKILKRRRDLKLIISSATVDAEYIRDFFNRGKETSKTGTATILSVEGKMRGFSVTISHHGVLRSKLQRRHFLPELSMCRLCEGLC